MFFVTTALFVLASGCGGKLVHVTGQVVANGEPVALAEGESLQVDFSTADGGYPPLSLGVYARRDGSLTADLNDGTGQGLPPGKYKVRVNGEGTTLARKINPKLFKESLTVEVGPATRTHLTIDVGAGTLSQ
jgi:hypothetical protein